MLRKQTCINVNCNSAMEAITNEYKRFRRDKIWAEVHFRVMTQKANIREDRQSKEISELKKANHILEKNNNSLLGELEMKEQEIIKLKEELATLEASKAQGKTEKKLLETKAQTFAKLYFESHKEKINLQKTMDQERVVRDGEKDNLERELEEQRRKVAKLEEVIDKQMFDLDEARSGSWAYSNTLPLGKTSDNDQESASLAQEESESEYAKEIQQLKVECEELEDRNKQLDNTQEKHVEFGANYLKEIVRQKNECGILQEKHLDNKDQILLEVNKELVVMKNIESRVSHTLKNMRLSWFFILSAILWIIFVYQITPIVSRTQFENCHSGPSPAFLEFVADFM